MNKENILLVSTAIREYADNFSLKSYACIVSPNGERYIGGDTAKDINCDTVACICGWANVISNKVNNDTFNFSNTTSARKFLGLSVEDSEDLFCPRSNPLACHVIWEQAIVLNLFPLGKDYYDATAKEAASILEAIADGRIELCEDTPY